MHPRDKSPIPEDLREELVSRRKFLARAGGAALSASTLALLLDACGSASSTGAASGSGSGNGGASSSGGGSSASSMLPRPDHPVTWPLYSDNKSIPNGLAPEKNATLQVFNWSAYLNPKLFKQFEKKYDCKVQLTTFTTLQEGLAKVLSGKYNFDVYFPEVDILPQLIEGKFLQPLNHSYVPNMANLWQSFDSPWYDVNARYTVPYTVYTTGLGYRTDHVHVDPFKLSIAQAWGLMWDPRYRGRVGLLDDVKDGIGAVALKLGYTDFNTGLTASQLNEIQKQLLALISDVHVQVDTNDYTNLPEGRVYIHQAWSGDMVSAPYYMPKGQKPDVLAYWYTLKGGMIDNDLIAVMKGGQNPVLAHLFVNFMLDFHNVMENMSWTGYQQPQRQMHPDLLIKEGLVPSYLRPAIVQESYFKHGYWNELPYPPTEEAAYQQVWARFKAGV